MIGFLDDYRKLRTRKGILAKQKFGGQILAVGALMTWLYLWPPDGFTTALSIPFFKGWLVTLGALWVPFAVLVIVGASNAVNLTDGLDGLAIGPIVMAGGSFRDHRVSERQLPARGIPAHPEREGHRRAGHLLRARWWGPPSAFSGSTPIRRRSSWETWALSPWRGAIGTLAVLTKSELLLPLIGGIYVVEAVSVIIQVAYFKLTGRRFFRMAPLHHHYEMEGWPEPKIIVRFWIVSFMLALLALTTLKLR